MKERLKIRSLRVLGIAVICCITTLTKAQYTEGELEGKAFYDTRIVNGQSVETNNEGVMKFIIAHRFGPVNGGGYEL